MCWAKLALSLCILRAVAPACRAVTAIEPLLLTPLVEELLNSDTVFHLTGVALGLALMMYGREEGAETLIEQMTRDQDPIIRYGGMYTIGMAYR